MRCPKLYTALFRVKSRQKSNDASNKNIIDELGLEWLDFGARNYDADVLNELKKRSTKPASDR